jgi:hypothetical protein
MKKPLTRDPGSAVSQPSHPAKDRDCLPAPGEKVMPVGTDIRLLINSALFFLDHVFIHCRDRGFRLVVLHNRQVYFDGEYQTLREAQAAFLSHFRSMAWKEGISPDWSCKYRVEKSWLKDKYRLLALARDKIEGSASSPKKSPFFDGLSLKTPRGVAGPGAVLTGTAPEEGVAAPPFSGCKQYKLPLAPESFST